MTVLPTPQNTAWQQSHEIDLNKTAILVIDVLGDTEGTIPALAPAAANAIQIVKAARAQDIPIIFANDAHIPGLDFEIELWGEHGMVGTEAAQPLADFDVQSSDFIIPKRRYDAFFMTDLGLTLRELEVNTLIVFGFDTNICVLQTLAGAYFRGYKTIVPADACETFLIGTQEDGLAYFSRCYDSRIVSTEIILGYLGEQDPLLPLA